MYCCSILFCYVLIIILHNSCLLAQKEPITINEEYLRRRGHTRSSFDYNFSDLLHSNDVVSQGQPDKMVTHNFTEDKNDKSFEDANEETLDDTNNRTNGEPHRGLLKKPIEDATVEKEVKEQKLDQVLDDQEPVVLVQDGLIEDSQKLVTNDQSDLLVHDEQVYDKPKYKIQDKYELPIHGIIGKQSFNIPELGIHETFIPNAKSSLPKIKSNYINKILSSKQVPKYKGSENNPKAIIKDTTDKANDEAYDDATVTTKKYHHIPKPSTPRHETVDIFQKVLENDLKEAEEYKTTNKLLVTVQKPKTAKKLKKVTYDKTQPINFMNLYTSSDSDKESVPKNVFKKPIKDKSVSEEKISVDFKDINHKNDEKRETTKVHDVKLTLNVENITTNEPAQTESEEINDELKNYYNRGKLVSGQTVKDIMDGKNVFFTYTNEYPLRGRRNLDDSVPESIEPNTGELVSEGIHIDNYDPVDGTIDGLGPVKIDKTITNNGTQAKKHHHHHHHHKKHHSKNKVRQQPTGFPGRILDRKGPFIYDDLDESSKELEIINKEQNAAREIQDMPGIINDDDMPGPVAPKGGLDGPMDGLDGLMGGSGIGMGFPGGPMGGAMDGSGGSTTGPGMGMRFQAGAMGLPMGGSGGPMGGPMFDPNGPMGRYGNPMGGPSSIYNQRSPMGGPGNPMSRPGGAGRDHFGLRNGPGDLMGRAPWPSKPEGSGLILDGYMGRDGIHAPNIDENGAMVEFPTGNLDSEHDYGHSRGTNFGPRPGVSGALRNRPQDYVAEPNGPMSGPGGSMGRLGGNYMDGPGGPMGDTGGRIGRQTGFMGGPGAPMGKPQGYGFPMRGPDSLMGGPGGPMGRPQDYGGPMGGPDSLMGGPGGPMGRPQDYGGPMGGPDGPMGGPDGPMGGPDGPMGRSGGPLGGPGGPMGGPGDPMHGPSGPMGGPGGPIGGLGGPMNRPGGSMGGPGGPIDEPMGRFQDYGGPIGGQDGPMGGPGDPMSGPNGPMDGPGGSMGGLGRPMGGPGGSVGGPGGPMGGQDGPMGGPGGPMGGLGDPMYGPSGPMGGPGGPIGGLGGPMNRPGGSMGGPGGPIDEPMGRPQDYGGPLGGQDGPMGGPGDPMSGANGPMDGPDGSMGGLGRPMGGPGGSMGGPGGPMGGQDGPMGGPGDPMSGPNGPMDGPGGSMGGLGRPMGGSGGSMGGPGGPMGGPDRPLGGPGGPMDGPGGPMGGPDGPMSRPRDYGGPIGETGGPMGRPGSPMVGPNSPIDPDYYGAGGANLQTMKVPNQGGINQNYYANSYYGSPAQGLQSQYSVYNQGGSGYGPGSLGPEFGLQFSGNPGEMGQRGPLANFGPAAQKGLNIAYTQRPPDPGGPFDPDSRGPLGFNGDPNYIKKVQESYKNITVNTDKVEIFTATTAPGGPGVQENSNMPTNSVYPPRMPSNIGFSPNGPNIPSNNGFPPNTLYMQASIGPRNGLKLDPIVPSTSKYKLKGLYIQGFNGSQRGHDMSNVLNNVQDNPSIPQNVSEENNKKNTDLLNDSENHSPTKRIGPPVPKYLVPFSTTMSSKGSTNDFPGHTIGNPVKTTVPGSLTPSHTYTNRTDADNWKNYTKEITKEAPPNTMNVTITTAIGTKLATSQNWKDTITVNGTKAATVHKPEPATSKIIPMPSVKYDSQGKPITSKTPIFPIFNKNNSPETKVPTTEVTTTQDPLKVSLDLYPDPPPKPAPIPSYIITSERSPSNPFEVDFLDQADDLKNGMLTMFLVKLADILAKMEPDNILNLVKWFSVLLRKDDVYLHFKFYGEPFRSLFVEKMEEIAKWPAKECQQLAAKLHQELITRHNTLSSDLNSVLDFADKIVSKDEGVKLIKLLEKLMLYPQVFDVEYICNGIVDDVFLKPMDRTIKTSSFKMFVEGLNTYLSMKYRNNQPIKIPDPPQDRRKIGSSILRDGVSFNLNYVSTRSLGEPIKTHNKLITIPTVDEIINNNGRHSHINDRHVKHHTMKHTKSVRMIMDTNEPILGKHRSAFMENNKNNAKSKQFLRRLKEESFKKNIATKTKDVNIENNSKDNSNSNDATSDGFKLKRRQSNSRDTDNMKMDMDLHNDFEIETTTFPHTFLELEFNDETTKHNQFTASGMPPELEINNDKDVSDFFKTLNKQNSPPGFPLDMFKPPNEPAENKNKFNDNDFSNPLNLNPNNVSSLHPTNFYPMDFNNNISPLSLNPNNSNAAKPLDLLDDLRDLLDKASFDQPEKTVTDVALTIPSSSTFVTMTMDFRLRTGEDVISNDTKDPETTATTRKKRKKKRKPTTTNSLKDQINKYMNDAKDIINTEVRPTEKKLKSVKRSKDAITFDRKIETSSQEKNVSKVSKEEKGVEELRKNNNNRETKSKEREILDLDSAEITKIVGDDDDYGIDKDSREMIYKLHKQRRKKKKRKRVRNPNRKYKTSHKHRKVHMKHRYNKHKNTHKHRHKKHHKYRYLVLEDLRRENVRRRSDLPSVELNSKTNSEYEDYEINNNDYETLREKITPGRRNTRFYIVKNVRSGVSTPEQSSINKLHSHKRFNVIRNDVNTNMTINSGSLDINENQQSALNTTARKPIKANESIYTTDYSSSSSSIEFNDGLPIDKWALTRDPMPTNASEPFLTAPVKSKISKDPKIEGKQKYLRTQQNLDKIDTHNDTDYLSRNDEIIFSDWLRTIDRLKFTTPLKNRRSHDLIKPTVKSKHTTNNVKSILFFKASDEIHSNDTDKPHHSYYKSRKRRQKDVKRRKIRKTSKTVQSHEKRLVKTLAKQFQVLEKINKKFEKAKTIHGHNKHNATEVTKKFDVDKHLDLDIGLDESNKNVHYYKTDKIIKESSKSRKGKHLKDKQNTTLRDIAPDITSTRGTIEKITQVIKKPQPKHSLEMTTLRHKKKYIKKVNEYDYELSPYYSNTFPNTDQTRSLKNVDDLTESHQELAILRERSKETSFVTDDKVEFMSDEVHIVPEESHFVTKSSHKNNLENWQRNLNEASTFLPKQIRKKIIQKISKITNHNDSMGRHNKKFWEIDVSESSGEEKILKINIYKYFNDNGKMQKERDELKTDKTYVTKGDQDRKLDETELKNDSDRIIIDLY